MSMGYKGKLFVGNAGARATNLVTNCEDVDYSITLTKDDTSERGDGSAPPIEVEQVAGRKPAITIKIREKDGDTNLAAMKAAAYAGAPIAVLYLNAAGGSGFDGDMTFDIKNTQPLKGKQVWEFSGTATNELRDPLLNAAA